MLSPIVHNYYVCVSQQRSHVLKSKINLLRYMLNLFVFNRFDLFQCQPVIIFIIFFLLIHCLTLGVIHVSWVHLQTQKNQTGTTTCRSYKYLFCVGIELPSRRASVDRSTRATELTFSLIMYEYPNIFGVSTACLVPYFYLFRYLFSPNLQISLQARPNAILQHT